MCIFLTSTFIKKLLTTSFQLYSSICLFCRVSPTSQHSNPVTTLRCLGQQRKNGKVQLNKGPRKVHEDLLVLSQATEKSDKNSNNRYKQKKRHYLYLAHPPDLLFLHSSAAQWTGFPLPYQCLTLETWHHRGLHSLPTCTHKVRTTANIPHIISQTLISTILAHAAINSGHWHKLPDSGALPLTLIISAKKCTHSSVTKTKSEI